MTTVSAETLKKLQTIDQESFDLSEHNFHAVRATNWKDARLYVAAKTGRKVGYVDLEDGSLHPVPNSEKWLEAAVIEASK